MFITYFSYGQKTQPQSFNYTAPQIFSDSVKMNALGGSGTVIKIDENGYLYRSAGTSTDTINIGQVLGLQDSLNLKQYIISVDSNFVFTNNKIYLNDTIWTEVGKFSDEIQVKNTAPQIIITDSDASVDEKDWRIRVENGNLRIRTFGDDGSVGGNNVGFYRTGNVISSLRLTDSSTHKITLKNSGTGVFEDTVRSGQLKVGGILYPLSDGTSGQVLTTNGSGIATFSDVTSPLIAGTGITISNDTISSTGAGSDADWTINGNYVYNLSDNIGIGVSDPEVSLEVAGRTVMSNINTTLTVTNTGASSALNLISNVAGNAVTINNYDIDSVSNDATLSGNDDNDLVTESAVKGYVDNAIENNTRVSWGADVDTSARVNGFVLKWNGATKKHYYDTAGTGGGGSTYFAGAGLELSGTTFSIGNDSVSTAMVQDDAITYSKLQNVGANSVLARAAASSGDISEVSLSANQLLGRGSTGNVDAIGLSGLSMVGKTLTNTNTGTVTNIAAGNGMTFSSITTTGTVTMGTPEYITGTSTNSVSTNGHTHAVDFTNFQGNIKTFYLDTTKVSPENKTAGKIAITNQEKVISFTMSREVDSVRLRVGYYTLQGMVDIEVTNDDTTAGVAGFFQNYQLNAFVTDGVQLLGRTLSGTTTVIETAEANETPQSLTDNHGSPKDGTIKLHLTTVPVKFYLSAGQFVALTIKANYPSPADFVSHKRATMILTRAIDFDGAKEQIPDIEAP